MKTVETALSLKPEAVEALSEIAAARQRQGIPMDTDTILSGIVNTYAAQMLDAVRAPDAFKSFNSVEELLDDLKRDDD